MDRVADKHPQLDVKLHFAEGIVLHSPKSFRTLGCHACVSAFLLQIGGIAGRKDWEVLFSIKWAFGILKSGSHSAQEILKCPQFPEKAFLNLLLEG